MKTIFKTLTALPFLLLFQHCKKNNNDDNNGNPNNGNGGNASFKFTGYSPEYVAWGEELTLNGSNLPTNAGDYSFTFTGEYTDTFKTTVYSASATQLKIKAPIARLTSGQPIGPSLTTSVIVTAGGRSDTVTGIKMTGWPRLGEVCSHFGGASGNYFVPGDSAVLSLEGATGIYSAQNNLYRNVALTANPDATGSKSVAINWSSANACTDGRGATLFLDANAYGARKCPGDPGWNGGWRTVRFTATVPGTDRSVSRDYLVYWQPNDRITGFTGPQTVTKTGNVTPPQWTVAGVNMFFEKARFSSANCSVTPQEVTISSGGGFYNTITFDIPLSVLAAPCDYSVQLVTRCGDAVPVGSLRVNP